MKQITHRMLITLWVTLTGLPLVHAQNQAPEQGGKGITGLLSDDLRRITESIVRFIQESSWSEVLWLMARIILFTALVWWGLKVALFWISRRLNWPRLLAWWPRISSLIVLYAVIRLIWLVLDRNAEEFFSVLTILLILLVIAARDDLKALLAGFWLLVEQPFQIGDRIQVGEYYGTVKQISLRNTRIVTLDDSLVTIPNSLILSQMVANANDGKRGCLVVTELWLPVDADTGLAHNIAWEAVSSSRYLDFDQPVQILFSDHFGYRPGLKLTIKAYTSVLRYEKALSSDITRTAKQAFLEKGVLKKEK